MGDTKLFLIVLLLALAVKIALSILAPPSPDLVAILQAAESSPGTVQPWTRIYAWMLSIWRVTCGADSSMDEWWLSAPFASPPGAYCLALVSRAPVLIFDAAIGVALYFIVHKIWFNLENARLALVLWIFNPYVTFFAEVWGAPDVAASFFVLVSIGLALNARRKLASALLGVGTALKLFPIFLLPLFVNHWQRTNSSRRDMVLSAMAPLIGLIAYFWWLTFDGMDPNLWLEYTPVTQPVKALLEFTSPIPFNLLVFSLTLYYFAAILLPKDLHPELQSSLLGTFLVYTAFSDIYPHYLLWALPLMTLELSYDPRRLKLILLILASTFLWGFLVFDGYSTVSGYSLLFIQLAGPDLSASSRIVISFLKNPLSRGLLQPLLKAGVASFSLIYAIKLFEPAIVSLIGGRRGR